MATNNARQPSFMKFIGKLRTIIAAIPATDTPSRPWTKAYSREIQLELDFGLREGFRQRKESTFARRTQKR
jgi:hypothetical protein